MGMQQKGSSLHPQWPKSEFTPLSTVFKAMETYADRAVCFTRKILVLFEQSICSFVLKMAKPTGLNTNLRN